MENEDSRHYNVTNKVASVLDLMKGFDVAGSPHSGNIIIRYEGINYLLNISPLYSVDGDEEVKKLPFETIVRQNTYLLG